MADEARVFAEGVDNVIVRQVTVANGTAIAKGALLVFSGASRVAITHTTAGSADARPAGFATSSKEASDGITEIGVQRTGVVDAYTDGTTNAGCLIKVGATTINHLEAADSVGAISYQLMTAILGRALEHGTDNQVRRVALTLG